MRVFLLTLAILVFIAAGPAKPPAHYQHDGPALLPDPVATPGDVRTTDLKIVCGTHTKQFRHTTAKTKKEVCLEYGLADCPHEGNLEIDHLIPLELGGADVVWNLWPQPAEPKPGFHEKDKLENYLHREVCAGRLPIREAQGQIATDWYNAYLAADLDKQ